jgi:hypothetical protein
MSHPVEELNAFIEKQREHQNAFAAARSQWKKKMPQLKGHVDAVVEAFRKEVKTDQAGIRVDVEDHSLIVTFDRRANGGQDYSRRHGSGEREEGAAAIFKCEDDCKIYGWRRPFSLDQSRHTFVHCGDLGSPETIQGDHLGAAVVDFLKWASVGDGKGSVKMQF